MLSAPPPMPPAYNAGDTAWLLASTAMVLLMTPGLAFFYGGMVRVKHVLMMIKMSFAALAFGSLVWWALGYTLAFGPDAGGAGIIGTLDHAFLRGIEINTLSGAIPTYIYATFQMGFAVVTVALISGSVADRARMKGWLVFVPLWLLVVYAPAAHWVFSADGWIQGKLGALDFAGGLPVELNSGAAGLAVALALRGPRGWARREERPNNIPLVVIGVGLLWFGWFGFNSGSALSDQGTAAAAFLNTQLGGAAAMVTWPLVEKWRTGKVTTTGVVSAGVAGMVAITPACGEINPLGAVITGLVAGLVCAFAVTLKYRFGVDDTLDVVGVHGVGGVIGLFMVGLFATARISGHKGLFYGGGWGLLGKQVVAILAMAAFSFLLTWLLAKLVDATVGFRAATEYATVPGAEAETAYDTLTADRLGALVGETATRTDDELVRQISRLIRARQADK
ncbi:MULTISPECIES: ammonium transporter [unclassified Streptomyces]|uniref:ammonium transporter n=1 Tax=unclassified Streptomyces TaxID=2593676 RepID=UPI0016603A3B|nr:MULTISPECIES: ammonium transporter [unclassified Streptomyces]MBD0711786.1 ammonia channel protein [Streptomyces sp. CBMA291]MBD0714768.1 ammonia channel protein [Streptomyces sp. CBMA370]